MSKPNEKNILETFTNGEFLFFQESKSLLFLDGSDSFKFMNSISSNEITNTKGSLSVSTLILTNKGRLIFDVEIYTKSDDSMFILCNLSQKNELIEYLKNYRMSYKVEINDYSKSLYPFKGMNVLISEESNNFTSPFILESSFINYFMTKDKIPETKKFKTDELDYKKWKILCGSPSFPNELNPQLIPIEADMWSSISFTKGCYIGQETIARIKYRGKVKKTLGSFRISGPITDQKEILNLKNERIGSITSHFYCKEKNLSFGLGFLKNEENFIENKIKIDDLDGEVRRNFHMEENRKLSL